MVCLHAPVAVAPATGVAVTCAPATGIASADGGGWVLTNSGMVQRFDAEWNSSEPTLMTGAHGIERGPDGSLWILTSTRVVRLDEQLDRRANVSLDRSPGNGSSPNDLVYVGRWLVLYDDRLLAYDAGWGNGTSVPGLFARLPDNATGMTATDDSLAVVTRDGTIHVYDRPVTSSIERRRSITTDVSDRAVDVHRESNDSWIVLEPYNATTVTDEGERIDRDPIFFSCTESGGVNVLLTMLGFAAIGLFGLLSIVIGFGIVLLAVALVVWYVRG